MNSEIDNVESKLLRTSQSTGVIDDAVKKCYLVAKSHGNKVFALKDKGLCLSSINAHNIDDLHGRSKKCSDNGLGGPDEIKVYQIGNQNEFNVIRAKIYLGTTCYFIMPSYKLSKFSSIWPRGNIQMLRFYRQRSYIYKRVDFWRI